MLLAAPRLHPCPAVLRSPQRWGRGGGGHRSSRRGVGQTAPPAQTGRQRQRQPPRKAGQSPPHPA
eukprot:10000003-Alexandrium_andersonii.AAC.1